MTAKTCSCKSSAPTEVTDEKRAEKTAALYYSLTSTVEFVEALCGSTFNGIRRESITKSADTVTEVSKGLQLAVYSSVKKANNTCVSMLKGLGKLKTALQKAVNTLGEVNPSLFRNSPKSVEINVSEPVEATVMTHYLWKLVALEEFIYSCEKDLVNPAFKEMILFHALPDSNNKPTCESLTFIGNMIDTVNDRFVSINNELHSARRIVASVITSYLSILPDGPDKTGVLSEPGFLLESQVSSAFNPVEFAKNPTGYLDSFVPPSAASLSIKELNWKACLSFAGPPLLKHFLEHECSNVDDWGRAKSEVQKTFALFGYYTCSGSYKYYSGLDLSKERSRFSHYSCCNNLLRDVRNTHEMREIGLGYITAITSNSQQKIFVEALLKENVKNVSEYNFYTLLDKLAAMA
ncbi:hypothetical protein GGI12_003569 [Dipsacomyces acuminosporus]|nr:hypothetical protein GGI12_003569 [Dipsacomyces acuminosporus]